MELLSPGGNYQAALIALNAGADAVYIGGKSFSARMSAENFSDEEMKNIIAYAHTINKKVYVTMNTLLFQDEFFKAVEYAKFLHGLNVDGIIIQDLGLAFYLHQVMPLLPLHASTQLNCHSIQQAQALKEIGFCRVVLARESNLELASQVKKLGLEVEVFGHGALCVSYSGNCLMSSFIGGRSGNRGKCAQPCRLKYSIMKDGERIDNNFSISTKDLMTLNYIQSFINNGVDSLKIEGRLKQDEYVYMVTRAYKEAINCYNNHQHFNSKEYIEKIRKIFSRNFTKGYVLNESKFNVLNQNTSSHQGVKIGEVISCDSKSIFIKVLNSLNRLDGIRFNDDEQVGFIIDKMFINHDAAENAKKNQVIEIKNSHHLHLKKGTEVIKTKDYLLSKDIDQAKRDKARIKIDGVINAYKNKPLTITIIEGKNKVQIEDDLVLEATSSGTSEKRIQEQISKTGNYPFVFDKLTINCSDNIFIPISKINSLRNRALDELIKMKTRLDPITINQYHYSYIKNVNDVFEYIAIANTSKVYDYLSSCNLKTFYYGDKNYCLFNRKEEQLSISSKSNLVHFPLKGNDDLIASCYCNITNSYALDAYYFLGFKECILSLELDNQSIKMMVDDFYNRHHIYPSLGIIGYGYIDLMIMKSCPIGTYYHQTKEHCNLCHNADFSLKDRLNVDFPLYGDEHCDVHVLNSLPIYLLDRIDEIIKLKINHIYMNFTIETPKDIDNIINEGSLNKFTRGHFNKRPQ